MEGLYVVHVPNSDKGRYVIASAPTARNNIRFNWMKHQTKTKMKTHKGKNSYVQDINKATQDTCFQKLYCLVSCVDMHNILRAECSAVEC
jgi:hypothetical protein